MKTFQKFLTGISAGFLNGLFGTGGGLVVIPILEKIGIKPKKAHATSIAIILPLSIISGAIYLINFSNQLYKFLFYIPFGLIGAYFGCKVLNIISTSKLQKIFGIIIIISAIRMFFK